MRGNEVRLVGFGRLGGQLAFPFEYTPIRCHRIPLSPHHNRAPTMVRASQILIARVGLRQLGVNGDIDSNVWLPSPRNLVKRTLHGFQDHPRDDGPVR